MLLGVLMRMGKLLTRSLLSSRQADDAGEDAVPAEDGGNGEGAVGMSAGGGKAVVAVAAGDPQAVSPLSKARRLHFSSCCASLVLLVSYSPRSGLSDSPRSASLFSPSNL
jgi:hypothetical protein